MKSLNKKVRNATPVTYEGIEFKSKTEMSCYKLLKEEGFDVAYEPNKYILHEKKICHNVFVYSPYKIEGTKHLMNKKYTCREITYTPDFFIEIGIYRVFIDVKGNINDTYPIKKKLFIEYLSNLEDGYKYIFIDPIGTSKIQLEEMLHIIKSLKRWQ